MAGRRLWLLVGIIFVSLGLAVAANGSLLPGITVAGIGASSEISFQDGVWPDVGYTGTRDTQISAGRPGTAYGQAASLKVDGEDGDANNLQSWALLKWDVSAIPSTCTVETASVTLNVTDATDQQYQFFAVSAAWSEATTWNTRPGWGADSKGIVGSVGIEQKTFALDATLVGDWVSTGVNHGVIIADVVGGTNKSGMAFDAREAATATSRPKLTVYYTCPGDPTSTPTPTPTQSTAEEEISFQDGAGGYAGTRDSTISQANPDTNYGASQTLLVDGQGTGGMDDWTLIRWDVSAIPADSTIYSASITLHVTDNGTNQTYHFFEVEETWTETTVTWNNAPGWKTEPSGSAGSFGSGAQTFDLNAALVKKWVDDPTANHGIIIADGANTSGFDFDSREAVTMENRPMLTVHYTPGTQPPPTSLPPGTHAFQDGLAPYAGYDGTRDTYIAQGAANTNFGSQTSITIDGSDSDHDNLPTWALLNWDLSAIPTGHYVNDAVLTLWVTNHSGGQPYYLYALNGAWNETGVTWTSRPAWGAIALGTVAPEAADVNQPYTVALNAAGRAVVAGWVQDPASNYGLIIANPNSSDGIDVYAREWSTANQRPRLTITHDTSPAVAHILKGPYLQNVSSHSIEVMWEADVSNAGQVRYRIADEGWQAAAVAERTVEGKFISKAMLTSLIPNTLYQYQVSLDGGATWIPDAKPWFYSPPASTWSGTYRVVGYGDSRATEGTSSTTANHEALVSLINALDPPARMLLHTGDLVDRGTVYEDWEAEWFGPAQPMIQHRPVFPVPGNHEYKPYDSSGHIWYNDFFSWPDSDTTLTGEEWYAATYGCARIIGLNAYETHVHDLAMSQTQLDWLDRELASDAYQAAQWHLVFLHWPLYTSKVDHQWPADQLALRQQLIDSFAAHGVDMVIEGHVHSYERQTDVNGIQYIVTGGGGADLYECGPELTDTDIVYQTCRKTYHFTTLDISCGDTPSLVYKAIDKNGNQFDTFSLPQARTYTVTTADDEVNGDGCSTAHCSLREAIITANNHSGQDTINLPVGEYRLTRTGSNEDLAQAGDLDITDHVIINPTGSGDHVIDGQQSDRIFHVVGASLQARDLIIQNGQADYGGGLFVTGTAILTDTIIQNNHAIHVGGAIRNWGDVRLYNSSVLSNTARAAAGLENAFKMNIAGSTVSHNVATEVGGGLVGGGEFAGGHLRIENSTIGKNQAGTLGGGIFLDGYVELTGSQGNTIGENQAGVSGGGIYLDDGWLTIQNSIVAKNMAPNAPDCLAHSNEGASLGNNRVGNAQGCDILNLAGATSPRGQTVAVQGDPDTIGNPGLGGYKDSGQPGAGYFPVLDGSPVIDAGNTSACTPEDQLGNPRTDGDGDGVVECDIGAVEYQGETPQCDFDIAAGDVNGLIAAINAANANCAEATINLAGGFSNKYQLSHETGLLPRIETSISIIGQGIQYEGTYLDRAPGACCFRIIEVGENGDLHLEKLTVMNGKVENAAGGGIYNAGSLTLKDCRVLGNTATQEFDRPQVAVGGGIMNVGRLHIDNCLLDWNSARQGGGIFSSSPSADTDEMALMIDSSDIHSNSALSGGGLWIEGGSASVSATEISDNHSDGYLGSLSSPGGEGGGIYSDAATLILERSSLLRNHANSNGGGMKVNSGSVTILESILNDNVAESGGSGRGGGLSNAGVTIVEQTTLHRNSAGGSSGSGGALANLSADAWLSLSQSIVTNNSASYGGGIVSYYEGATVIITDSVLMDNYALFRGGGIYSDALLVVSDTEIRNNRTRGPGGGINNQGDLEVTASTFLDNQASLGGGLYSSTDDDELSAVTNSTFYSNTATTSGGAIHNANGNLLVNHSTLTSNSSGTGGGIFADSALASVELKNTVIAGSNGGDCEGVAATDNHHSMIGDDSCSPLLAGDPILGPLQDNGGPTLTHMPLAGSPLIDAGDISFCNAIDTDQIGNPRLIDGAFDGAAVCDIGAVEFWGYLVDTDQDYNRPVACTNPILDNGDCSLREAVRTANNAAGRDTIFVPAGSYYLDSSLLITDSVVVKGEGYTSTLVAGGQLTPIIGSSWTAERFDIQGLHVKNTAEGRKGTGIIFEGKNLNISDSIISNTASPIEVASRFPVISVVRSKLQHNDRGISVDFEESWNLTNSSIISNTKNGITLDIYGDYSPVDRWLNYQGGEIVGNGGDGVAIEGNPLSTGYGVVYVDIANTAIGGNGECGLWLDATDLYTEEITLIPANLSIATTNVKPQTVDDCGWEPATTESPLDASRMDRNQDDNCRWDTMNNVVFTPGMCGIGHYTSNGQPGNGHFPLLPGSALIDAGTEAMCSATDQLGNPRTDGDGDGIVGCDVGAAEYQPPKPGDCNGDGRIVAADITAVVLELFDSDGNLPKEAPFGAYPGTIACDANQDRAINAGDIICTVLTIFGQPCGGLTANEDSVAPELSVPGMDHIVPGQSITVPLHFSPRGQEVGSIAFSLDIDPTWLVFDPADADEDGVPDAVHLNLPPAFTAIVAYDPDDGDGELDFAIADLAPPLAALPAGDLVGVELRVGTPPLPAEARVAFSSDPHASFGSIQGEDVAGATIPGIIRIGEPWIYLPAILRSP